MYNSRILKIMSSFVSKEDVKKILMGINFNLDKKRLEATDGHRCMFVYLNDNEINEITDIKSNFILMINDIILSAINKSENFYIDKDYIYFFSKDLNTEQNIKIKSENVIIFENYPNFDDVINDISYYNQYYICINPNYLPKDTQIIHLKFSDNLSGFLFGFLDEKILKNFYGVIMPIRPPEDNKNNEYDIFEEYKEYFKKRGE